MPYNNLTDRADAAALIPEEVSTSVLTRVAEQSAAMSMFRRIPASRAQVRIPVLSALPIAYWVTGDTGLKQTTELGWANKFLNIEEIAVIVPFPNNVLDDTDYPIWDEAESLVAEAVGRALDSAIFFGANAPATFPTDVNAATAAAAGNSVAAGSTAAQGGYMGDIDKVIGAVEEDGFDVTGFVASLVSKGRLRTARDSQGQRVDSSRTSGDLRMVDGLPVSYAMRGLYPTGGAVGTINPILFAGDWTQYVLAVRKDITYEVSRDGVIQDAAGTIVYNLFQQDMSAMRVTFRAGWQVANVVNYDNPSASRYPAARLTVVV